MELLRKRFLSLLLYQGKSIDKENMIWNMAGSFCYAFASMVLAFLVMRLAGEQEGGVFAFGFSAFGQQMFIVAYFGIRPYHITDGKGEYSFGDYLGHRRLTCLAAAAAGLGYPLLRMALGQYGAWKAAVVFLLALYKIIDGYADVYESEFQRQGSLYLTGKSNTFRTLLTVAVFLIVLVLSGNLMASCVAAVAAQAAGVALFNGWVIKTMPRVSWGARPGGGKRLFYSTWLLFLSVFLDFYIFSASKYAIDMHLNDASSGYFNIIFMPTSVIYMVANFIIRPFLTKMTWLWNERRTGGFRKVLQRIGALIVFLTALAAGAAWLLGHQVLTVMEFVLGPEYHGALREYHGAFLVIVLGGGFYALANLMYYALVIMRKQKTIFTVYAAAALAAAGLSGRMVEYMGINGAAGCYLILMCALVLGFGLCTWGYLRKCEGNRERQED